MVGEGFGLPSPGVKGRKNGGSDTGTRSRINFIEGSNVTITLADDSADDELDITIAASAGSSGATPFKITVLNGTGNKTVSNATTSRAALDATNLDYLTLSLSINDVVRCCLYGTLLASSGITAFDFEVDQPTSANTYVANGMDGGVFSTSASNRSPLVAVGFFTATEAGSHGFRPVAWTRSGSGTSGTVYNGTGNDDIALTFSVENLGASA